MKVKPDHRYCGKSAIGLMIRQSNAVGDPAFSYNEDDDKDCIEYGRQEHLNDQRPLCRTYAEIIGASRERLWQNLQPFDICRLDLILV
jgi:hypothetical protein